MGRMRRYWACRCSATSGSGITTTAGFGGFRRPDSTVVVRALSGFSWSLAVAWGELTVGVSRDLFDAFAAAVGAETVGGVEIAVAEVTVIVATDVVFIGLSTECFFERIEYAHGPFEDTALFMLIVSMGTQGMGSGFAFASAAITSAPDALIF